LSAQELEDAWTRGGRSSSELADLSSDVRAELSHPFTLRAFLELDSREIDHRAFTRASILARWVEQRLRAEADPAQFLTADVFRQALMGLARRLQHSQGWVRIDDLHGLPRFDPVYPPGPAIQRLVAAGLVEISNSALEVRFGHESIADFFLGALDAGRALEEPERTAHELLDGSYSNAVLRLEVIGHHVKAPSPPVAFVERLARVDSARAIAVMQAYPDAFDGRVKASAVSALAAEISGRFEARAGFAVDVLGRFRCVDARHALVENLHPFERCPAHLQSIGAQSIARSNASEAADVTYRSHLFDRRNAYYFSDILHVLRSADEAFRETLGRLALADLDAEPGSKDHTRAVHVLGYLGDHRLVEYLARRFGGANELMAYENHALLAIGTEAAARLFEQSANAAAARIVSLDWKDGGSERSRVFHAIAPLTADLPYLFTPAFENLVHEWLVSTSDVPNEESASRELKLIAISLARSSRSRSLARLYVMAKGPYANHLSYEPVLDWVDPRDWSRWWHECADEAGKYALVRALPGVPTPAVEEALVDALRHPRMAFCAARYLGDAASWIGKRALRELVAATTAREVSETDIGAYENCVEAIRALGRLRDHEAVGVLNDVARRTGSRLRRAALASLGLIGALAAEEALTALLDDDDDNERTHFVAGALVLHGSGTAVRTAIELATSDPARGAKWLVEAVNELLMGWGWRRGQYFVHIHDDLGRFLRDNEPSLRGRENWDYLDFLERIDTPSIRDVLRDLARRRGTDADAVLRDNDGLRASRLAYEELFERGDSWALPELIRQCTGDDKFWGRHMAENLLHFRREDVADAIRRALGETSAPSPRAELIRLLGFFGAPSDAELIKPVVESVDPVLANAADEAVLRLADPLRIPDNWSSLRH
jgi:hypothetical protein